MRRTFLDDRHRSPARGQTLVPLLVSVALVALLVGGLAWYLRGDADEPSAVDLTHVVAEGRFLVEVTEKGDLESFGNQEVRCEVKARNSNGTAILRVIPEGTRVQKDEFLVELDSSALESDRTQQQIIVNTSEALMIQARNQYETAEIARTEYLQGTFEQERQTIQGEIFVAKENVRRAEEYLTYSRKLAARGYIARSQLEADAFAVENAENELATAKTKLRVLQDFTKLKMLKQLESDIATSKAKWEAEQNSHQLELEKLADIDDQIAKCTILSPGPGIVVYANETDYRGNFDFVVEEGAVVRERQLIIRLPDPSRMQVKITINESLVDLVSVGMPASIRVVSLKDTVLPGQVTKVNQYSEPTSRWSGNVKGYSCWVQLEGSSERVRTGMTAEVVVHCRELGEVLQVPAQALYAHGADYYCFGQSGPDWRLRQVEVGPSNDAFVVVTSGLERGEVVSLNPRAHLDDVELPRLSPAELQRIAGSGRLRQPAAQEGAGPSAPGGQAGAGGEATQHGAAYRGGAERTEGESTDSRESAAGEGAGGGGDPAARVAQMIGRLDKDGDGSLSVEEWPAAAGSAFAEADTDGNGRVGRTEMTAAMRRMGRGSGRPGAGGRPAGEGRAAEGRSGEGGGGAGPSGAARAGDGAQRGGTGG